MLVHALDPPFSPGFFYWQVVIFSQSFYPSQSSSDGHISVKISGVNPNSEFFLDQERVEPIALILTNLIIVGYSVAAHFVVDWIDMQVLVDSWLIEEVINAYVIITVNKISQIEFFSTLKLLKPFGRVFGFIVVTWQVNVKQTGVSGSKLFV